MAGVYGLSGSGMDVDALVKNLMKAQRTKYDSLQQKKTQVEWKKADYNAQYKSINEFRNTTVFTNTLQSNLMPKQVVSSDEKIATLTATGDASNVNHSLTVTQLAAGVTKTSSTSITATGNSKDTLANQFAGLSGKFDIQINGKTITVDTSQSITNLVSSINKAGAGVKANYDATLDRFFMYSNDTGSTSAIDFSGSSVSGLNFISNNLKLTTLPNVGTTAITSSADTGYGTDTTAKLATQLGYSGSFALKIKNGTDTASIAIDTTIDTMDTLLNKINTAIDPTSTNSVKAKATYDSAKGIFSLAATGGTLDISGSDAAGISFLTQQLKLPPKTQGTDAAFILDGTSLTKTSNNFTIANVTYGLKSTGTVTASVSADTTKTIANVKSFIEAYNTQLSKITTATDAPKYKEYLPLTEDQKTAMKEADITAWETKAKSGMLRNETILQSAVMKMRNDISAPIADLTGKYNSASSIGITTGSYSDGGKLYLDEDKLKKALETDPEIVNKIFGSSPSGATHAQKGIAVRLSETLKTISDKIVIEAGATATVSADTKSSESKQIAAYTKSMKEMNARLTIIEKNYYKKFNAMETALAKLNKQSSWLAGQTASTSA